MLGWLSQYLPEWLAQFTIALWAALIGTMMRLGHEASRDSRAVTWRRFFLELPTIFGMAIIAGPIGRFLNAEYRVDLEVIYALCVVFGYLGANLISRAAAWLEKRGANDAPTDD